jgi:serine phosphatase RsbU (regulator of sigma subunit)
MDRADGEVTAEVVLVEDDQGDALLVLELLAGRGAEFSVVWVRSMSEALESISSDVSCVVLDLGLPDVDGLSGLEAILGMENAPAVVVLTGSDDRALGEKALARGAQDYLSKGFIDEEVLARSLRYAMLRRKSEEDARHLREAELQRAESSRLQRGLLPTPLISGPELNWVVRYRPGGGRSVLGGDFYDAIELEDGLVRLVVGDVCGHGPDEAALGVALRVAWRSLVLAGQSAQSTLEALQKVLIAERSDDEKFATLCDIELDLASSKAQLRLAGHPGPLLFDGSDVSQIGPLNGGPVLGVFENASWNPVEVDLGDDWTLVVFTDGIIESRLAESHERLDLIGLVGLASLAFSNGDTLESVADMVVTGAESFHGDSLSDDVILLLLSGSRRWARV